MRAPGSDTEGPDLGLVDGVAPVVRRFASRGQLVCEPTVSCRSHVVLADFTGGCTIIGADEDQSRIHRVLEQLAGDVTESPPPDQEHPESWLHPYAHPLGTPGTRSHLFQEGVCADFPQPQWQGCRHHRQHDILGHNPELLPDPYARPRRQSEAPIRYLPVPHSAHTARSAVRPFFIVTRSTSRDGVLARHFRQ